MAFFEDDGSTMRRLLVGEWMGCDAIDTVFILVLVLVEDSSACTARDVIVQPFRCYTFRVLSAAGLWQTRLAIMENYFL